LLLQRTTVTACPKLGISINANGGKDPPLALLLAQRGENDTLKSFS